MAKTASKTRVYPDPSAKPELMDEPDPMLPITVQTVSPEFLAVIAMGQKAYGFDLVVKLRADLKEIEVEIRALQKSGARNRGDILSQRLGQASQLRHTIELVFDSLSQ